MKPTKKIISHTNFYQPKIITITYFKNYAILKLSESHYSIRKTYSDWNKNILPSEIAYGSTRKAALKITQKLQKAYDRK